MMSLKGRHSVALLKKKISGDDGCAACLRRKVLKHFLKMCMRAGQLAEPSG